MVNRSKKILVSLSLALIFTACGSDATPTVDKQRVATDKIAFYAQNSNNPKPTKQDYIDAGVENIDKVDINELNALVAKGESKDVNTLDELNSLARTIMDITPPVITLVGQSMINIPLGKVYSELGATANDNRDGVVGVTINSNGVDTTKEGTYTVTYTAMDHLKNRATTSRTVTVQSDLVKPVITVLSTTIKEGADPKSVVSVVDNVDGNMGVVVTGEKDTLILGSHTMVYTARDTAGNIARKEVVVMVIPLTVTDLFVNSKEFNDVSYLVVGDSTRYYEGTNDILINSRDSDAGYYKDLLSPKNIKFMHTSIEGQRVDLWLTNEAKSRNGGDSFTINDTIAKIKTVNPRHCIVEFSMGINDDLHYGINDSNITENITLAMSQLKRVYPNLKILLVSPVPYNTTSSITLNSYYEELKDELSLPFVSGYNVLKADYPSNTLDNLHPNEDASKELVDAIFEQIENGSIYP